MRKLAFLILLMPVLSLVSLCGCNHFAFNSGVNGQLDEANDLFRRGHYEASLRKYDDISLKFPAVADRVLLAEGIIYSHPRNEGKDYRKALECLRMLMDGHRRSGYRYDGEMIFFHISTIMNNEAIIASQRNKIGNLQREVELKEEDISSLEEAVQDGLDEIETLQEEIARLKMTPPAPVAKCGPADKILIEKKARRMTLMAKGAAIKTYKIALGGNPDGPKESEGDNKTPEGTYFIDSRNRDSRYHLSLHISYPSPKDKKLAKQRRVSPGGNIMIHGMPNGFSWLGAFHAAVDWTKGCIAVTDEEIEEIATLTPNGTVVEIRP